MEDNSLHSLKEDDDLLKRLKEGKEYWTQQAKRSKEQAQINEMNKHINKAIDLQREGKYQKSIISFDKALSIECYHPYDLWLDKGNSYVGLHNFQKAVECFLKALEINPNALTVLYNMASLLNNLEQYSNAIKYYDKCLKIDPNFSRAWNGKAYSLLNTKRYSEAIECYDTVLKINPNNADAWNGKGNTIDNSHPDRFVEAIACYDKALEIDPKHALSLNNKAWIFANKDRNEEALPLIERALENIGSNNKKFISNFLDTKGYILFNSGKYEESIVFYKEAMELNAKDRDFPLHMSLALSKLGRQKEAKEYLRKAEKLPILERIRTKSEEGFPSSVQDFNELT